MTEFFKPEDLRTIIQDKSRGFVFRIEEWQAKDIAKHCNAILEERGVRVFSVSSGSEWTTTKKPPAPREWYDQTRTALLIAIEPIKRDTAESLLREMLALEQSVTWRMPAAIIERARKVLGKP